MRESNAEIHEEIDTEIHLPVSEVQTDNGRIYQITGYKDKDYNLVISSLVCFIPAREKLSGELTLLEEDISRIDLSEYKCEIKEVCEVDILDDVHKRLDFYRQHKDNSMYDTFYHSHLNYIEDCIAKAKLYDLEHSAKNVQDTSSVSKKFVLQDI